MARNLNKRLKALDKAPPPPSFTREDPDDDVGVSWVAFTLLSLLAVLALLAAATFMGVRSIESDLEARSRSVLYAAGYDEVTPEATGTDVLLLGNLTPEQSPEDASVLVADLNGVRAVDTRLWVVDPSTGEKLSVVGESLTFQWADGHISIGGDVSSEAMVEFITLEAARVAERTDLDSIDATGVVALEGVADESEWLGAALALVATVASDIVVGELVVNPSGELVIVSGEVDTRQQRRDLQDASEESVQAMGFTYRDGITLKEKPPPPPEIQVVELQQNLDELIEGKVVEFKIDSDEITEVGTALLDEILDALLMWPDVPVEISGHADAQGSEAKNQDLSERRAAAVLAYLVAQGEAAERFIVVGYGETRPIADNATEEGRQKNRRIEFIALLE